MTPYLRDPDAIYASSFATIRAEADLSSLAPGLRDVAIRMIHACGMTDIVSDLRISEDFVAAATKALANPILTDAEMLRHGIIDKSLQVICTLNDPRAREIGIAQQTTRSATPYKPLCHLAICTATSCTIPRLCTPTTS